VRVLRFEQAFYHLDRQLLHQILVERAVDEGVDVARKLVDQGMLDFGRHDQVQVLDLMRAHEFGNGVRRLPDERLEARRIRLVDRAGNARAVARGKRTFVILS